MRFCLALVCFALVTPVSAGAGDATLPERKAGLWDLKTVMDEGNGPNEHMFKMCIDAAMEKMTVKASIADHKANCTKYEIKTENGATVADGECTYNGRLVVSRTEMKGDFKTAFDIKISSTTSDPNAKDQSVVIKRTITQSGRFANESCGDLHAGEAMAPDGSKILVQ